MDRRGPIKVCHHITSFDYYGGKVCVGSVVALWVKGSTVLKVNKSEVFAHHDM